MATLTHLALIATFAMQAAMAQESASSVLQFGWTKTPVAMPLPQDLCGFSIEADRWPDWAGNVSHRNDYTYTLLDTLKQKTGVAPRIRVGGATQDHLIYTPNVVGNPGFYDVFAPVPEADNIISTKQLFPEASFIGAGPNYYLCAGNLPEGTTFTWGVDFGAGNASEAVAEVQQIVEAFNHPHCGDVILLNVEIGNEADHFSGNKRRPGNWSIWDYTAEQIQYFEAINSAIPGDSVEYRVADWANTWNSEQLFATGILASPMGRAINAISEHHYQSTNSNLSISPPTIWPSIAADLTNKAYIRGNLSQYGLSVIDAQRSGIPFVLGETNTYAGHGQPGVSNAAAAALWFIDYSLQAASMGVTGLYFHQGIGYNYSAFEPIDNIGINITDFNPSAKRHVLPSYYGYLAVADAIGTSGNTAVNELWTDSSGLAAYQIWEGAELKRLMLINEVPWTQVSNGTRPVLTVTLSSLVGRNDATYKSLVFPSLSVTNGLTWGGQSWETYTGLPTGTETFETLGSDGTVQLSASSAVLIYL